MDKDYFKDGKFEGNFEELWAIINILRRECPWDREQTVDSVKFKLVEESYEAIDSHDSGDIEGFMSEIGDVILVALFLVKIMEDEGKFTLHEVLRKLIHKLVRRHPHIFGEKKFETAGEVLKNWEKMKEYEMEKSDKKDVENKKINLSMPALYLAYRIFEKMKNKGEIAQNEIRKLSIQAREKFERFLNGDIDDVGDLLLLISQICAFYGVNPEEKLRWKIKDKFA